MKIRNGFVSNSSSSSFIIRGVKVKEEEIKNLLNISSSDRYWYYNISSSLDNLTVETTRYYFGGDETGELIIGNNLPSPDDGQVMEIPENDDAKTIEKLERVLKRKIEKLSTFIQFVSNDNY